jgi:hypothetical protein
MYTLQSRVCHYKKKKLVTNSNTTEMERLDEDQERRRGETKLYSWREEGEKDAGG